jgi:Tfp pilus assembly PilM family ATPase
MGAQTAIEYGARRVRLVEFDGSARKLRVLGVKEIELTEVVVSEGQESEDVEDVHAGAIAEAMDEAGFATDPSAMAFDAGHAMFREFDLPFTNDEQIAKVVRFEAESHFPGDIDDYVVQHVVLRKTRDKSHLLAVAVKKDDLLDRLDVLDESSLDPMLVDIDDLALFHALVGTGLVDAHARFAVVNAQDAATSLLLVVDGHLYALRSIRIGTHGILHEADVTVDEDVETARVHDFLSRLLREIRRTLSTLPELGELEALYVTGSGSRLPGFAETMSETLGVEAQPLDFLEHVDHKLSDEEASRHGRDLGAALGMAFKLNGLDVTRTDFRREEAAYTRKFDQVKTPLIVLSFLIFLVVAFLGLDAYMDLQRVNREYDNILRVGGDQLAYLMGDETEARRKYEGAPTGPRRVQAVLDAVRGLREDIAQQLGRSQTIPELHSALAVWIELFEALRDNEEEVGRFALQRVDINVTTRPPLITLSGQVEDLTHYARLLELLKGRAMFTEVDSGSTSPISDGVRFSDLKITLDLAARSGGQT